MLRGEVGPESTIVLIMGETSGTAVYPGCMEATDTWKDVDMSVITIVVVVVVVLAAVAGLGLLIFRLQRRSQTVVPRVADEQAAKQDRVVAVDAAGRPVTESEDVPAGPARDPDAFEHVLSESLDDLHRPEPPDDAGA
jgi:hypothetical protein